MARLRSLRSASLGLSLLLVAACSKADRAAPAAEAPPPVQAVGAAAPAPAQPGAPVNGKLDGKAGEAASTRKVIRTAELSLEADDPEQAQRGATQVAESMGGYVSSSDVHHLGGDGDAMTTATVVIRVPAERFSAALDELRKLGRKVTHEKIAGQDVTEEYLDLEARLRAQRAVEAQFLEIMKDAKTVKDALEVQQKLGEVRGEIERVEGRRRFLENQTGLSTITLSLTSRPVVAPSGGFGFGESVRAAAHDAVSVGAGIVTGGIRLTGVMVPIALFIGLPVYGLIRLLRRRKTATPRIG